jgi:hypothetical protein
LETLTGTLTERVDKLVHAAKTTGEWGDPRLSVTPTSVAIPQLVTQIEALETAVREIALEVQRLSAQG